MRYRYFQVFRILGRGDPLPKRIAVHARVDPAAGEYYDADIAVEGHTFTVTGNLLHRMFALRMIHELEQDKNDDIAKEDDEEEEEGNEDAATIIAAKMRRQEQIEALALQYGLPSSRTAFVAVEAASRKELATRVPATPPGSSDRQPDKKNLYGQDSGTQWRKKSVDSDQSTNAEAVVELSLTGGGGGGDGRRRSSAVLLDTRRRSSTVHPDDVCGLSDKRAVLFLASLQAARGSFGPDERIDRLAGITAQEAEEMGRELEARDAEAVYTALAVALLEEKYPGQAASWQLIVEKARRWMVKVLDEKARDLLDRAAKMVKQPQPFLGHMLQKA
jgi:hypothetical protein